MRKFSFTIEFDGQLSFWYQKGDLTPDERSRFDALKKQVERLCQTTTQLKLISNDNIRTDGTEQKELHPLC